MLLIFDLDDTLIDTTACLTPLKLEKALSVMIEQGLCVEDFQTALEQLKRINLGATSARAALIEFLDVNDADSKFLEIGIEQVYERFAPELPVFAFDDVPEVLTELSISHRLALVTKGYPDQQLMKLKKAGIDSSLFSKIFICRGEKQKYYQQIVEEMSYLPSEVVVCGDRIEDDLIPAKELGFKTVHMKRGRGVVQSVASKGKVDVIIESISQLKDVIAQFARTEEFYRELEGGPWRPISLRQA